MGWHGKVRRSRARLGSAGHGVAWLGMAGAVNGLRPVAGIEGCLERTGDGSGRGMARYGEARLGKARVVTKRLRLVVGYTKGAIPEERRGNRGIWPITWRKPAVLWAVFQQGEPEKKKADD